MHASAEYLELVRYLTTLGSVVVAFSGGTDSTLLLRAARDALGDHSHGGDTAFGSSDTRAGNVAPMRLLAVTVDAPYMARWEIEEARDLARVLGVDHEMVRVEIADAIRSNPPDKCYLCKRVVFESLKRLASDRQLDHVVDGTNADDIHDYRPGLKALKELGIKSPLLENGLTKASIRQG